VDPEHEAEGRVVTVELPVGRIHKCHTPVPTRTRAPVVARTCAYTRPRWLAARQALGMRAPARIRCSSVQRTAFLCQLL
jgi:hypothetical protein